LLRRLRFVRRAKRKHRSVVNNLKKILPARGGRRRGLQFFLVSPDMQEPKMGGLPGFLPAFSLSYPLETHR
jgi:hypothetical protein